MEEENHKKDKTGVYEFFYAFFSFYTKNEALFLGILKNEHKNIPLKTRV